MAHRASAIWVGVAAGLLGLVAVVAAAGLIVVYGGLYNIAATEEHVPFVRWAFATTFDNSVERRARDLVAPEPLPADAVERGSGEYKATCQHCHGGPGAERAEWASGMRPRPPHLANEAAEWSLEEVFWLAKHGAKMTGMPAFGPTHDDQTLWSIAAFVKQLPAMTPERYAALGEGHEAGGHGGGGHGN